MEVVVGLPVDEVDLAEQFLLVVLEFSHHFVFCSVNFFEIITYFCLKINFVHVHVVLEVAFVIVWKMNQGAQILRRKMCQNRIQIVTKL